MSDEIKITGSIDLVEVVKSLHHAVEEMKRLGKFVRDETDKNDEKFIKLSKQLTTIEVRVASISGVIALITSIIVWKVIG